MHNSGLPDRYRLNKVEFTRVEDYLKVSSHVLSVKAVKPLISAV